MELPADFNWMGPAACEHCKRLRMVDISQTDICEIMAGAFAHCSQLQADWPKQSGALDDTPSLIPPWVSSMPHLLCYTLTNGHLLAARNCACSAEWKAQ